MKLLAAAFLLTAPIFAQSLDFETYRTKVEPIFLKKRPTHARCIVCHEGNRTAFRLAALAEGQKTWTAEQSKQNYDNITRLQIRTDSRKRRQIGVDGEWPQRGQTCNQQGQPAGVTGIRQQR